MRGVSRIRNRLPDDEYTWKLYSTLPDDEYTWDLTKIVFFFTRKSFYKLLGAYLDLSGDRKDARWVHIPVYYVIPL